MSGEGGEVNVRFKVQKDGLTSGMAEATHGIKDAVRNIQGQFGGLGEAIEHLKTPFLALTGIIAGGALFKEAVSATREWNGEAIRMAKTLGITTQQASVMNVALEEAGASTDMYLRANQMMTRQLNTGGKGFEALGLSIRGSDGKLKSSTDLMSEAIEKLNGIEQGSKRNAAGMQIFGRAWGQMQPLLRLNAEAMEEAKQKAEKLGLMVGGDATAAMEKYRKASAAIELDFKAMKIAIGQELLPVLADLAEFLGEILPPVVTVLKYAIKGLISGFETLVFIVKTVGTIIGTEFGMIMDSAGAIGRSFVALLKGDFKTAAAEAGKAGQAIKNNLLAGKDQIVADFQKLGDQLAKVWDKDESKGKTKVGQQGTEDFDPTKQGKAPSIIDQFKDELDKKKEAYIEATNYLGEFSKQEELKFWEDKLKIVKGSGADEVKVHKEVVALKIEIAKQGLEEQKVKTKESLEEAHDDAKQRVEIARGEYEAMRANLGDQHRETIEAHNRLLAEERRYRDEQKHIAALARESAEADDLHLIAMEEQMANLRFQLGEVNDQDSLRATANFEERRYQIRLKYAQDALALETDPTKRAEALNKIEELTRAHEEKMGEIQSQSIVKANEGWRAFTNGFKDMLTQQGEMLLTFQGGWKQAWGSTLNYLKQQLAHAISSMVVNWLFGEKMKTAATVAGTSTRNTVEAAGAAKSKVISTGSAISEIIKHAYKAMAGAYAAIASIPYIGPFLAPVVAAGALAAVIGLVGKVSSAEGGFDIPRGVNPLTQLHEQEMVLPKAQANAIRSLADGSLMTEMKRAIAPPAPAKGGGLDLAEMKRAAASPSAAAASLTRSLSDSLGTLRDAVKAKDSASALKGLSDGTLVGALKASAAPSLPAFDGGERGGRPDGRGVEHHDHFHINAMDSQSFEDTIRRNGGSLTRFSKTQIRNFAAQLRS